MYLMFGFYVSGISVTGLFRNLSYFFKTMLVFLWRVLFIYYFIVHAWRVSLWDLNLTSFVTCEVRLVWDLFERLCN